MDPVGCQINGWKCLSIPALDGAQGTDGKHRFLFISENEILHTAGNSLQISTLLQSDTVGRINEIPYLDGLNDNACANADPTSSNIFASAGPGRGFSCFTYDSFRNRVAFSPRGTSPKIIIQSICERVILCELRNGVSIEYADISFSKDGSKVIALGKGDIDSKMFIWTLTKKADKSNDYLANDHYMDASLIFEHSFEDAVSKCLFNPLNDQEIAIHNADGKGIRLCNLVKAAGKLHLREKLLLLTDIDKSSSSSRQVITAFVWETYDRLLVGTSDGSIFEIQDQQNSKILFKHNEGIVRSVTDVLLSSSWMLVVLSGGHIIWFERSESKNTYEISEALFQIDSKTDILDISFSPDFSKLLLSNRLGSLEMYWTEREQNKEEESRELAVIRHRKISQFHERYVSALASIVLTGKAMISLILSGGIDGTIKGWKDPNIADLKNMDTSLATLQIGSPITSMETLIGYPVVAVGSADGNLRFVHVGKKKNRTPSIGSTIEVELVELKSETISDSPITLLSFNRQTKKLVAGCFESGQAFVLCTEPSNLHVIGVVETPGSKPLVSLTWCSHTNTNLYVGCKDGSISCFDTIPMCFTPDPVKSMWVWNLECSSDIVSSIIFPSREVDSKDICVIYQATKEVTLHKLSLSKSVPLMINGIKICDGFAKRASCIVFNNSVNILALGNLAGELFLYIVDEKRELHLECSSALHNGPIVSISFSADSSRISTSSTDGSLQITFLGCSCDTVPSAHEYDYLLPKKKKEATNIRNVVGNGKSLRRATWLCKAKERIQSEQEMKAVNIKKSITEQIQSIVKNIDSCIRKKGDGDDLETLDRSKFIIDEGRDQNRKSEIQDQVEHYRVQLATEIEDNSKVSSRLQKYVNASIDAFSKMYSLSLNSPLFVENFPLCSVSKSDRRKFDVVMRLKINEIFDMQRNVNRAARGGMCWASFLNLFPQGSLNYIFDLKTSASAEKKIASASRNGYDSDDDMNSDIINTLTSSNVPCPAVNLTYPPLSIRTNRQRRIQIILMQQALRDMASNFNATYLNLAAGKNVLANSINQIIDKILGICEELDVSTHICRPVGNDINLGELNSDCVVNENNDLSASDERRMEEVSHHPGLLDMMNGTLKASSVLSRPQPKKPAWMTVDFRIEELSETHKQELHNFDRKERKWRKAIEEKKQELETELKKKHLVVADMISEFDQKLNVLCKERERMNEVLSLGELYVYSLENTISETESTYHCIEMHLKDRVKLAAFQEIISRNINEGEEQIEKLRHDLHEQIVKDRAMEKAFKKNMQRGFLEPLDQETVNLLYQFFQDRRSHVGNITRSLVSRKTKKKGSSLSRRSKLGRQSGRESLSSISTKPRSSIDVGITNRSSSTNLDDSHGVLLGNIKLAIEELQGTLKDDAFISINDPFKVNETSCPNTNNSAISEIPHPAIDEVPEGFVINDDLWHKMLKAREEKIQQENILSKTTSSLKDMKAVHEHEKDKKSDSLNTIKGLDTKLAFLKKDNEEKIVCPEFVLMVKQGQKETFTINSKSAMFVKCRIVERANARIRELGNEQREVLNKIHFFGKKISMLKWKHDLLDLRLKHGKELHIDYQLLRLTAELKTIISGDIKGKQIQSETKDQILRLKETHQKKMQRLLKEKKRLQHCVTDREDDNRNLDMQLSSLCEMVNLKEEKSMGLMCDEGKHLSMKKVLKRSKLVKLCNEQSNIIIKLRAEVDRLRQKTFPCFPASL